MNWRLGKKQVGGLVALSLALLASAPVAMTTLARQGVAVPGADSAERLMALLDSRSPGERPEGVLPGKTKKRAVAFVPRERALGKVFPPKPSEQELARVVTPPPPTAVPVTPVTPPTMAEVVTPRAPAGFVPVGPLLVAGGSFGGGSVGGIGGGGGGGGGGIGGGGGSPETPVNPPVSPIAPPIPEPGTWLMMLLGFAMIGHAVRGRGHAAAGAAVPA